MPISAEEDCWRWRQGRGKLPDSREFAKQLQTLLIRSTAPLLLGSAGTQWDAILHPKSDCLNQCLRHTSVHPEMVRKAPCILTQPLAGCWGAEWGAKPSGTTPSCIISHSGEFCRTTKKTPLRWFRNPRADYSDKPRWDKLWYHQKGCKAPSHKGERWERCEL